ncbi:polysaccharide lyase family 7 protein [Flagellimonas sp. W118]|uniref:polysaccharide lyase family 7 protein n=1 Tax=Flagellimonas sp. W118 TaxID=3410791 RepID=UPI003BF5E1D6
MPNNNTHIIGLPLMIIAVLLLFNCQSSSADEEIEDMQIEDDKVEDVAEDVVDDPQPDDEESTYILPEIDLSNWKVTLPIGRPDEVEPPEILEYATVEKLKPFMYNDSIEGALVFYTYPGATTANSSRSRTELREQMEPGSNSVNWTFSEGGRLKGTLAMDEISKDSEGKYHRTIVMQIHGRLTNAQRDLIGEDDNNAPPMLKIYWQDGKVRVKTKILKNPAVSNIDILRTDSWTDDEGFNFSEEVGFDQFSLEVLVSAGRMEVILNDTESVVYDSDDITKWSVFENYFKAGNYLQTSDEGAFARVKYYDLQVEH